MKVSEKKLEEKIKQAIEKFIVENYPARKIKKIAAEATKVVIKDLRKKLNVGDTQ